MPNTRRGQDQASRTPRYQSWRTTRDGHPTQGEQNSRTTKPTYAKNPATRSPESFITKAMEPRETQSQDAQPTKHETEAKSATPASPRHQDLALTTTPNTQPHIEAMKEAPTNKPTPSYTAMPISRPQPHYNPTTARLRHHPTGPSHRHIVGPSRRHTGRGLVQMEPMSPSVNGPRAHSSTSSRTRRVTMPGMKHVATPTLPHASLLHDATHAGHALRPPPAQDDALQQRVAPRTSQAVGPSVVIQVVPRVVVQREASYVRSTDGP